MKKLKRQFSENVLLSTTSRHETQSSKSVRQYSDQRIPDDLLVEIFSRVPSKSIVRFRCVSKYLASILRRSDFTERFLTKSLNRPRLLFIVKSKGKFSFYYSPQPHNPDHNSSIVVTPYRTSFPEYVPCDYCRTVCGLVLLQGYSNRKVRVICNPATGEFLTLPKVLLKQKNLPKVKTKEPCTRIEGGMHLGYDPIGKHFKVLCMTSSDDGRPNTHQVLTLKSGKRVWRMIEHKFHFERHGRISGEICINGVLYFGGRFVDEFGGGRSSCRIVCFDFTSEKFRFINMDENMQLVGSYLMGSLTLFNYKGKLGLHGNKYESRDETRRVMWILEDDGNNPKWSELVYVLPHSHNDIVGHGMLVGGETVLSASHGKPFYVEFYNLESKTFKRVYIQGLEGFEKHQSVTLHTFVDYVETMKFM